MGSEADLPVGQKIKDELRKYGIASVIRICSAHKATNDLLEMLDGYELDDEVKVYVTIAGKSNALSALIDGYSVKPVVSCPPLTDTKMYDLYSSTSMPSYIAPMVVLNPKNAALAVTKICGLVDNDLQKSIESLHKQNALTLKIDDIKQKYNKYDDLLLNMHLDETYLEPRNKPHESDLIYRGKVRDVYESHNRLTMVATDRLSAFDRHIVNVPYKGEIINKISAWWLNKTSHIVPNHLISVNEKSSCVDRCTVFPIEFVVRGYMTGSTNTSIWVNYNGGMRQYCGCELPNGLQKNQKLPEILITPTTKGETDELITPQEIVESERMTQEQWDFCSSKALELFMFGQEQVRENGLILVDTKYEFGINSSGEIILVDEIHTPDSSRYWLANTYEQNFKEGKEPDNIDKEFIRKWIKKECTEQNLDVYNNELPKITAEMVVETSKKYMQLYDLITGNEFVIPTFSI